MLLAVQHARDISSSGNERAGVVAYLGSFTLQYAAPAPAQHTAGKAQELIEAGFLSRPSWHKRTDCSRPQAFVFSAISSRISSEFCSLISHVPVTSPCSYHAFDCCVGKYMFSFRFCLPETVINTISMIMPAGHMIRLDTRARQCI